MSSAAEYVDLVEAVLATGADGINGDHTYRLPHASSDPRLDIRSISSSIS
jgi:hypothetical protein